MEKKIELKSVYANVDFSPNHVSKIPLIITDNDADIACLTEIITKKQIFSGNIRMPLGRL